MMSINRGQHRTFAFAVPRRRMPIALSVIARDGSHYEAWQSAPQDHEHLLGRKKAHIVVSPCMDCLLVCVAAN